MRLLLAKTPDPSLPNLMTSLRKAGYAVDRASNGGDALWHAQNVPYDVIILDEKLPVIHGLGVLKNLRAKDRRTQILLLTEPPAAQADSNLLQEEADDCLETPFAFEELLTRLESLSSEKPSQDWTEIKVGDLSIDLSTQRVFIQDRYVRLIPREFRLLTPACA